MGKTVKEFLLKEMLSNAGLGFFDQGTNHSKYKPLDHGIRQPGDQKDKEQGDDCGNQLNRNLLCIQS